MRNILIIATFGLLASLAFVRPLDNTTDTIDFKKASLEEVLAIAKKENKHVYVDVSTSWCGYCKKMKARTYTDAAVIEHLNKNYISISIDAERGDGPAVTKKYRVKGYPTELILDEEGTLLSKNVGYLEADELIKFASR